MDGMIGSIVIIPKTSRSQFGDLFSVKPEANELFIATFDVKIDEVKTDNDKDQYKFEFYETASK